MRYLVLSLWIILTSIGCAHNSIYDVPLEATSPAPIVVTSQVDKKVNMVIYSDFEGYVYEQADSNWMTNYRIPIGAYTSQVLKSEFASTLDLGVSTSLQSVQSVKPLTFDYIVIPEFGRIRYETPTLHAFQDAQFSTELKLRVLDRERRELETIYVTGTETGVFHDNTPNLVQQSVQKAVMAAREKLVKLIKGRAL